MGDMPSRPAIPSLTGLRFIAAFSVVLTHATRGMVPEYAWGGWATVLYGLMTGAAGIGMPLFFVLSGFVIHYNYSDSIRREAVRGTFNFFVARFARLYPLYILGLGFDSLNMASYYDTHSLNAEVLPYYLTLTQSWFYLNFGSKNIIFSLGLLPQIAWSVSTEWFFYLTYPLSCYLISKLRDGHARMAAVFVAGTVGFGFLCLEVAAKPAIDHAFGGGGQVSAFTWFVYFSPYSRIFEFVFGCLIASYFMGQSSRPSKSMGIVLTVVGIGWTALWYFVIFGIGSLGPLWIPSLSLLHMSFGFAPGLGLLIYCCARYDNRLVRSLGSKWIVLGGEASYSLYLLHDIIVGIFSGTDGPTTPTLPWSIAGDIMRLCFCLVCCVGTALVTWRFVEVPARRLIRRTLTINPAPIAT